jgi:hypothetical protein
VAVVFFDTNFPFNEDPDDERHDVIRATEGRIDEAIAVLAPHRGHVPRPGVGRPDCRARS